MTTSGPESSRKYRSLLQDLLLIFFFAAVLVRPLFQTKYLQAWGSIESTFIADGRFLAAHWPHPLWQPLWYCGTRFDYVYPPVLRYGTALLTNFFIPVQAYHVFTAFMYCLGIAGVCFLVRVMGGTRRQGWLSAIACALISPSFLFISAVRHDAPLLMPQRLGALVRYGEGPHISSLSLIPFALGFAFLGLQRGRNRSLALASIFSALVVLTNFYGATALAIFYPVLVWSVWVAGRDRAVWLRALAIPALAYACSAFWLTPSYLRITLHNLRYVSTPGNQYSVVLLIVTTILFGLASWRWASRKPPMAWTVFACGCVVFMALNVLGYYAFQFRVMGDPWRLIPELDMALLLCGIEALRRLWDWPFGTTSAVRAARWAVVLIAFAGVWPERHFIARAWELYPKESDYQKRVEYRMSDWLATNMPNARTFVMGSTRFWWDAWHDNAEVGGGSDQGLLNPNPSAAGWEIILGPDPELGVRWLQSLGADAIVVTDPHSQDAYQDFKLPYKFAGVLPVLYDDRQGDVIYQVPRRYASLARVVDTSQLVTVRPVQPATNLGLLRAYNSYVEKGPDIPTTTRWDGTDSIGVHTGSAIGPGESVLVQITYDPAWRAYTGATELPIQVDAMDFIAIKAPPGTQDLRLVFSTPLGNRIGYGVSSLALLLCLYLGTLGRKGGSPHDPIHDARASLSVSESAGFPVYFRALRALLRWLNRCLPEMHFDTGEQNFDANKLARAESALRAMNMGSDEGNRYLARHIPRLAKTLALVPPPQATGRVLELGCYMQITPLLQQHCGYPEVRGAYLGPPGRIDHRTFDLPNGQFSCYVDHFDVERDEFPYPDDYFDLVVAGEIIEHMTYDPMWMLLEARRVLAPGGYLLITTPNVGSVTSTAKTLNGRDNPQIYFHYERPNAEQKTDIGHVREYTFYELNEAVKAAGFEIEKAFTTIVDVYAGHQPTLRFLALNGFSTDNRGEQTWCLARKGAALPGNRYPRFLYNE